MYIHNFYSHCFRPIPFNNLLSQLPILGLLQRIRLNGGLTYLADVVSHHFLHRIELLLALNVMIIYVFEKTALEAIDGLEQLAGVVLGIQLRYALAHLVTYLRQFGFALALLVWEVLHQFVQKVAQELLWVGRMGGAEVVLVDGMVRGSVMMRQELYSGSVKASGRFSRGRKRTWKRTFMPV